MRAMSESWQIWALGSAVFAAMTAILAKMGVAQVPSDFATLVRTGVILVLVAGIAAASGQIVPPGQVPRSAWVWLVLSGLATGASWLCYFRALKLGEASKVAPIDKLSVVFVAIFAALLLGEKLSALNWAGVALIGLGAVLVAL